MGEFGELLRNARAYKGVTLRDAERVTRIHRRYLAALENETFDDLPPLTYARGIVRSYAQYLGLDPVSMLAMFESAHGQRSGGFRVVPAVKPLPAPTHWAPNFAVIAFMVVMSAVVFAWLYSAYLAPPSSLATPTVPAGLPESFATSPDGRQQTRAAAGGALSTPELAPDDSGEASSRAGATDAGDASPPTPAATSPIQKEHTFEIVVSGRVWVEATVDGQVVLSTILDPGERRTFTGSEMHLVSGNAPLVRVIVDGVDAGLLGTKWDDEATFPRAAIE